MDAVKLLLDSGTAANVPNPPHRVARKRTHNIIETPLHLAARLEVSEDLQLLTLLLEAGARPENRDSKERTALHTACQQLVDFQANEKRDGDTRLELLSMGIVLLLRQQRKVDLKEKANVAALNLLRSVEGCDGTLPEAIKVELQLLC